MKDAPKMYVVKRGSSYPWLLTHGNAYSPKFGPKNVFTSERLAEVLANYGTLDEGTRVLRVEMIPEPTYRVFDKDGITIEQGS